MIRGRRPLAVVFGATLLTACGGAAGGSDVELSETAERGRTISNSKGCGACHGVNGEGGLAGPYVDLYGSAIELTDGRTVVADEEYLRRSITDPGAEQNAAYESLMPANDLTDDEIDAVIAYIRELSGEPAAPGDGG